MGGGEVLKKGWLVKSPPLEGGGMKSWRKRFFLLRSSKIIEYYKAENGEIKGVVNLEDCVSVHADLFHKKYKHVFDIQTKDRTYYLVAPTREEMTSWVTALCELCGFTSQDGPRFSQRSSSTLPSNISIVKTPLPHPPTLSQNPIATQFSPEVEKYLLPPEVVDLLRNKPMESPIPSGIPFQDALVQKGLCNNHSRTFSYPSSLRSSTGSSIDSPAVSQRSSQDPEYLSSFSSSTDGQSDPNSFTYDTPPNNQPATDTSRTFMHVHVPSHYDIPRSSVMLVDGTPLNDQSSSRAQMLSNNYMVPRSLTRSSDPCVNYDRLPPPRPVSDGVKQAYDTYDYPPRRGDALFHPRASVPFPVSTTYDYLPKRDVPLPLRSDVSLTHDHAPHGSIPLPPRSGVPILCNSNNDDAVQVEILLPPRSDVPLSLQTNNIYDVPPHPRPLFPSSGDIHSAPPLPGSTGENDASTPVVEQDPPFPPPPPPTDEGSSSSSQQSTDSTDCPPANYSPPQGNVPPPSILFRRESKGSEDEMIPNRMYDMVLPNGGFPPRQNDERQELEETLTHEVPKQTMEEAVSSAPSSPKAQHYVNLCTMEEEEVPPPIDRSLKPCPPLIDRSSKPRQNQDENSTSLELSKSFSESPLRLSIDGSVPEDVFSPKEVPRLTSHSVHYTQVTFDRKKPVPTPRLGRVQASSPQHKRVNYSDIDIDALSDLSLSNGSYHKSCEEDVLEPET